MKRVFIISDIYDQKKGKVADVESVIDYIKSEFSVFPEHARIYHNAWNDSQDITEKLKENENYADELGGVFYVVIYPEIAMETALLWAVTAITAAFSIYTYLTMPKPQKQQAESPNNELAGRGNTMRPNSRIPEIFGTVRSYPDLIAETYTFYNENGVEVERSLLCMTRGFVSILDVRDATTNISDIKDNSISIYDPNTSIIGTPMYKVGRTFTDLPLQVIKSKSITGQVLNPPNDITYDGNELYFTADGYIRSRGQNIGTDFKVGSEIIITGAVIGTADYAFSGNVKLIPNNRLMFWSPDNINNINYLDVSLNGALIEIEGQYRDFSGTYDVSMVEKFESNGGFDYYVSLINPQVINPSWTLLTKETDIDSGLSLTNNKDSIILDGQYTVSEKTDTEIKLNNPETINSDWQKLTELPNQNTQHLTLDVMLNKFDEDNSWVGWHSIYLDNAEQAHFNIHFPNGLYRQNSKGGTSYDWTSAAIEWQYITPNGTPTGLIHREDYRFDGNKTRTPFGRTQTIDLNARGSIRFRLCRTRTDIATNIQAEMRIKEVYLSKKNLRTIYEDLTVIQSEAVGNDGLYSIKERRLNCLVQRKLPLNGTGALTATNSGAQALIYLANDYKNGRIAINDIDIAQILSEENKVIDYFGTEKASEFSYTIDSDNLSFEEIAGMVTSSMFCEAFRYGSKLRMRFEAPQELSILLFNHRNTVPKSMKRTKSFGIIDHFDGVQLEYTSPEDDVRVNYIASDSANPTNLKDIKTSGIRNHEQAKTRAWREWNKLKYQNISTEFEALEESELLARNDRILVADNTKLSTIDGEILGVNGLQLELSQKVKGGEYDIYIQLPNGTIDIIPCFQVDDFTVQLTQMPRINLEIGRAFFQLISVLDSINNAYLVTEIKPQSIMTNNLICVNYDARYYEKDHEFFGSEV